jgi:hypothetical protein
MTTHVGRQTHRARRHPSSSSRQAVKASTARNDLAGLGEVEAEGSSDVLEPTGDAAGTTILPSFRRVSRAVLSL